MAHIYDIGVDIHDAYKKARTDDSLKALATERDALANVARGVAGGDLRSSLTAEPSWANVVEVATSKVLVVKGMSKNLLAKIDAVKAHMFS